MRGALSRARATRGLTLVELVVAVLVLSIAVVATFRSVDTSGRQIGAEAARLLARVVAENRAGELRLAALDGFGPLSDRVQIGPRGFTVRVSYRRTVGGLSEAIIAVQSDEGPGAVLVTYLPAAGGG